ncbi:hypothetical protein [Stutzerimonas chloritidismutans]|uniref:hypothetical protein n=1 Tax=Stutzerimonas chloritidismutans TaxID=203192 RepID=UPI003F15A5FB
MFTQPLEPLRLLLCANLTMAAGIALLLLGVTGAYLIDRQLPLMLVVASHALVILGPTALKIGYVMRLAAQRQISLPA